MQFTKTSNTLVEAKINTFFIHLMFFHKSKHITFSQKKVAKRENCWMYAETKKDNYNYC